MLGSERLSITPAWTLGRLKSAYPSVELVLFSHFGVGSRERSGFHADETLGDLLRRHLIFDAERACLRLTALAHEDVRYGRTPLELKGGLESNEPPSLIDVRAQEEFDRVSLPGAVLFSPVAVEALQSRPGAAVVCLCRDGSQSPSASRFLRGRGVEAYHLAGGLQRWSLEVDPQFPILYPLQEVGGQWYLLADDRTLRFRRTVAQRHRVGRVIGRNELVRFELGSRLSQAFPSLDQVITSAHTFAVCGDRLPLDEVIEALAPAVRDAEVWEQYGEVSSLDQEREALEKALALAASQILASHKGTVEIKDYRDRALTLALGGGCAGCASAQITTQRELAAALYRAVPLLDRIVSSTPAESP